MTLKNNKQLSKRTQWINLDVPWENFLVLVDFNRDIEIQFIFIPKYISII